MAYDASREKQIDFGKVAKNQRGDYIKVQRIVPLDSNRLPSIDVRNMYTATDGNIYPARQGGVRLNSELVVEVMKLMYKAMSSEERLDFQNAISEIDNEEDDLDYGEYTEQGDD